MFKKILLPVDLGGRHQQAIASAIELAKKHDAEVVLLHIVELISGMPPEEEGDFYADLQSASRERLAEFAQAFVLAGVRTQTETIVGSGAAEILRFAVDSQIELIVLTSPEVDPDNPSSIANSKCWKISALTGVPVLLVK